MQEIQDGEFLILECPTNEVEMYQMKLFYYRQIEGIKTFRFSMTEERSYLYFPDKGGYTLREAVQEGMSIQELMSVLKRICTILMESKNNLLYEKNFSLRPEWIYIERHKEGVEVELVYLPLKAKVSETLEEAYKAFIQFMTNTLSDLHEIELFYYFKRLEEEHDSKKYMETFMKVVHQY